MKRILIILLMISANLTALAHKDMGRISGSIQDVNDKGVQSATVSLLSVIDSSLVKVALTNNKGEFEFVSIREGRYLLSVSAVGFDRVFSQQFEISLTSPV